MTVFTQLKDVTPNDYTLMEQGLSLPYLSYRFRINLGVFGFSNFDVL